MNVNTKKSVLISPLCWGLGHTTRCIPIIRAFLSENCSVTVLANAELIAYLQERFTDVQFIEDKIPCIKYGRGTGFFRLISIGLRLFRRYRKEQRIVRKLEKKQHFDIIVSDNRYGIWNRSSRNILITHQTRPILNGFLSLFTKRVHRYIDQRMKNFENIWVPDYNNALLSGKLSEFPYESEKFQYIGILSRFEKPLPSEKSKHYYLIISSGPRAHRIKMTDYFINNLSKSDASIKIIGESLSNKIPGNIELITNPDDETFAKLVSSAACIISHSGYSTIMDLIQLKKNAIIIPTPGQSEQKYLGKRLQKYFVYAPTLQQALHFINIHIDELPEQVLKNDSKLTEIIQTLVI